jgi:hypothetical protein
MEIMLYQKKKVFLGIVYFKKKLTGPFALLLWVGGILNEIAYGISDRSDPTSLYLGIVLMTIVILTAAFSYAQTSKSAEIMA